MSRIRLRKTGGFTIVELVAIIVVLGVCLAPFGITFYTVMQRYAQPEAQQVATALAEGEMERLTGLKFFAVSDEGPTAFTNFPNYTYQVIVSAVPTALADDAGMDEYKQVEVRVVHTSLDTTVRLITVVSLKKEVS